MKFVLYRNFYQTLQKTMFQATPTLQSMPPALVNDIFEKYRYGTADQQFPFRLYSSKKKSDSSIKKQNQNGVRGPYRRYSRQQKEQMIIRILHGITLKSIAEETGIPKRNLIRWKHEFIHSKSVFARKESSISTDDCRSESKMDREWIETKQSISEEQNIRLA